MSAEHPRTLHTPEVPLGTDGLLDIPAGAYVVGNIGAGTATGMLHNVLPGRSCNDTDGNDTYVVDIDFDPDTVAQLQSDNRVHNRNHAVVVQASADAIPVRDETFDELYVFNVVGEGLNTMRGSDFGQKAVIEILSKLKEGSTVYIGECDTPEVAVRNLQQISVDAFPWEVTVEALQNDALRSRLGLLGMNVFEKAKFMEKNVLEPGNIRLLGSTNAIQPYNPFLLIITKGQPRKKSV
jgi:SAM-dependent methyltransferase